MCDYSLHNVATRPAQIEDKLVTTKFSNSITRGLCRDWGAACCSLSVAGHGDCVRRQCRVRAYVWHRHPPQQENRTAARALPADQHAERYDPSRCAGIPGRAGRAAHAPVRRPARDGVAIADRRASCGRWRASEARSSRAFAFGLNRDCETESHERTVALFDIANVSDPGCWGTGRAYAGEKNYR